jgi:hypothetical protein
MPLSLHGLVSSNQNASILASPCKLVLPVLMNKTLSIASQALSNTSQNSFIKWIKSFFYKPITIIDDATGRSTRVFVRVNDAVNKLKTLGLSSSSIKEAIKHDNLLELVVDQKIQILMRQLPHGIISQEHLREALLWVNEHGHELPRISHPLSEENPIKIEKRGPHFYFVIENFHLSLDEASPKLNREALFREGFDVAELEVIEDVFKKSIQIATEHFKQSKAPIVDQQESSNPYLHSSKLSRINRLTYLSPQDIFLDTKQILGAGSYKTVKKVVNIITGKPFASYTVTLPSNGALDESQMAYFQEIYDLKALKGEKGLIKLYDVIQTESDWDRQQGNVTLQVLTKHYNKGSLKDFLERTRLPGALKLNICKQLISGLKVLHHKNLIHRDFKPGNILVRTGKTGNIKVAISDFGSLVHNSDDAKKTEHLTTCWYASPEYARSFVQNSAQGLVAATTPALDMWSLGVVLYQMVHGTTPEWIRNLSRQDSIDNQAVLESISRIQFPVTYPHAHPLNGFISQLLSPQESRLTIDQAEEALNQITL